MEWIRLEDGYVGEAGNLVFRVRLRHGTWHWRASFIDGSAETAHLVGDSTREQPRGYIDSNEAIRAAERWYEARMERQ